MSQVEEERRDVTEATPLSLDEFCAWWRNRPPLFDDAPLNRRMYWDENLEAAFRQQVTKKLDPKALQNVEAFAKFRRPVRAWMREVVATTLAGGRADQVNRQVAGLSAAAKREFRRQNVAPEWIKGAYDAAAQEQVAGMPAGQAFLPSGYFEPPKTMRDKAEPG